MKSPWSYVSAGTRKQGNWFRQMLGSFGARRMRHSEWPKTVLSVALIA
jgi:hypothetical protein